MLMGQRGASSATKPTVILSLQNRGVISIVLGDYQYGALLENGQLLTWGQAGATGLGDPTLIEPGKPGGFRTEQERSRSLTTFQSIPDVHEPTEVRFDHELAKPRKRFVFGAAAAGWHMGALVVDLEEVQTRRHFNSSSNLMLQGEPELKKAIAEKDHEKTSTNNPLLNDPSSTGIFSPLLFRGAMYPAHHGPLPNVQSPQAPGEEE